MGNFKDGTTDFDLALNLKKLNSSLIIFKYHELDVAYSVFRVQNFVAAKVVIECFP